MREILLSDLLSSALSRESDQSLQRQIYEVVRRAVLDHTLAHGQKLPSSRQLSSDLGISRITVSLAYDRLIAESYLSATTGSGTFVANTGALPRSAPEKGSVTALWRPLAKRGEQISSGSGGIPQHWGAFVPGVADASMFPFHIWKRLLARNISKVDLALSGYAADGAGYLPLRQAITSYLAISRAVVCDPEQVIVTSGTHQSIDLCARMLADVDECALVESPCHWAFPAVLEAAGLHIDALTMDENGADLAGSTINRKTRLVAVSPSHQYPTGIVMPLHRRLELLELARKHGVWILEDDYDSEFRYDSAPIASLQGLDSDGHVIYMGTFSKATFPGMRMSYIVVPKSLAARFSAACAQIYRPGQLHVQAALADLISEGHFSQNIRRMRTEYAARQQELRDAIGAELDGAVTLSEAKAGLHLFARISRPVNMETLLQVGRERDLVLRMPHFITHPESPGELSSLVLGFGGVRIEAIRPGVKRLAQAIELAATKRRR
ncbi:PLP-dependent aminotransferase family protein [Paraburkholderia guartelaensis]|uniref:PLP-dependent aminotransferase family protein n=1 Tax=Paraburkholderia guartelaensis TaxID=2546446 RepID=A0A4R5L789_9BURK|nr:PLP-dependent aminotransferase family protein [Paraburkholderia guartelaensis]TDG03550.1 PLP-dependent aminotransferase family protein [Paraburkholderia guartelaensis]